MHVITAVEPAGCAELDDEQLRRALAGALAKRYVAELDQFELAWLKRELIEYLERPPEYEVPDEQIELNMHRCYLEFTLEDLARLASRPQQLPNFLYEAAVQFLRSIGYLTIVEIASNRALRRAGLGSDILLSPEQAADRRREPLEMAAICDYASNLARRNASAQRLAIIQALIAWLAVGGLPCRSTEAATGSPPLSDLLRSLATAPVAPPAPAAAL